MAWSPEDDLPREEVPRITPAVQWAIALAIAVYFLQVTIIQPEELFELLGFQSAYGASRLWTIVTYMTVHGGFWHLVLNLWSLFVFGPRVEWAWGAKRFTWFYLWCGIGGVLAHALFVRDGVLIGASAAILGVLVAFAKMWPDEEVMLFGVVPMKVKWMVAFLIGFNVLMGSGLSGGGGGTAYLAHVGGIVFALAWLVVAPTQGLASLRSRISAAPDLPDDETPRAFPKGPRRERPSAAARDEVDEIVAKSKAIAAGRRTPVATRPVAAPPREVAYQAELDRVLDKISASGLESLTASEKQVLDEMSKRLRGG